MGDKSRSKAWGCGTAPTTLGRGGSNLFSLSPGPAGQFSFHKSVFFVRCFGSFAAVWVESDMSSKADMSDAIGEFRSVPIADI